MTVTLNIRFSSLAQKSLMSVFGSNLATTSDTQCTCDTWMVQ